MRDVRCGWSHAVFEALNGLPRTQQGSDMMRVRPWYLEGQVGVLIGHG